MKYMQDLFLGQPTDFWMELKDRADNLNATAMLKELVLSNAKVRYYEQHLKQMQAFAAAADSMH